MSFPLGQPITSTFLVYSDPARTVLADTEIVTVDVLDPTGGTATYSLADGTVTHASIGTYKLAYAAPTDGHYRGHWEARGTVTTSYDFSFDVDAEYTNIAVTAADFKDYIDDQAVNLPRIELILRYATRLCESFVSPLPSGAEVVILDVAQRAYAVPPEGVGPYAAITPGTMGAGGLFLTQDNKATLQRLAGRGGAFTIDTIATTAGQGLPWWDTGTVWAFQ